MRLIPTDLKNILKDKHNRAETAKQKKQSRNRKIETAKQKQKNRNRKI